MNQLKPVSSSSNAKLEANKTPQSKVSIALIFREACPGEKHVHPAFSWIASVGSEHPTIADSFSNGVMVGGPSSYEFLDEVNFGLSGSAKVFLHASPKTGQNYGFFDKNCQIAFADPLRYWRFLPSLTELPDAAYPHKSRMDQKATITGTRQFRLVTSEPPCCFN